MTWKDAIEPCMGSFGESWGDVVAHDSSVPLGTRMDAREGVSFTVWTEKSVYVRNNKGGAFGVLRVPRSPGPTKEAFSRIIKMNAEEGLTGSRLDQLETIADSQSRAIEEQLAYQNAIAVRVSALEHKASAHERNPHPEVRREPLPPAVQPETFGFATAVRLMKEGKKVCRPGREFALYIPSHMSLICQNMNPDHLWAYVAEIESDDVEATDWTLAEDAEKENDDA